MQNIVTCGKRCGEIKAIASKSHIHRLLICAALSDKKTVIRDVSFSKDIMATVGCLNGYLADIFIDKNTITVQPYKKANFDCVLNLNESGTTFRFLLPVACAIGQDVSFIGAERLTQRPISHLYDELVKHGCTLSERGVFPLYCSRKLEPGEFYISGEVSSQYISGLMFALPLLEGDSVIHITGKLESYPYIEMTLNAVRSFGIEIEQEATTFYISGNQRFVSPKEVSAQGDWSNAAFFLTMGAFSSKGVKVNGIYFNSLQGDRAIKGILENMGAVIEQTENSLKISGNGLKGVNINAAQIPDLVPILAVAACGAVGQTIITDASRLRLKESDRIESVYNMIKNLGGDIEMTDDGFIINGKGYLDGGVVDSVNDHRIVMAASAAACISKSDVKILCSEAVQKSYPGFFNDFDLLERDE